MLRFYRAFEYSIPIEFFNNALLSLSFAWFLYLRHIENIQDYHVLSTIVWLSCLIYLGLFSWIYYKFCWCNNN